MEFKPDATPDVGSQVVLLRDIVLPKGRVRQVAHRGSQCERGPGKTRGDQIGGRERPGSAGRRAGVAAQSRWSVPRGKGHIEVVRVKEFIDAHG